MACLAASPPQSFKVGKSRHFTFFRWAQFRENTGRNSLIVSLPEAFSTGFNYRAQTYLGYAKPACFGLRITKKSIPAATKFRFLYTKYRWTTDHGQRTTGLARKAETALNSFLNTGLREGLNGNPFCRVAALPFREQGGCGWRKKDWSESPAPLSQRGHAQILLLVKNQNLLLSVINFAT